MLDAFYFVPLHCLLRSCFSQYSIMFLTKGREDSSRTQEGLDVLDTSQLPQTETRSPHLQTCSAVQCGAQCV